MGIISDRSLTSSKYQFQHTVQLANGNQACLRRVWVPAMSACSDSLQRKFSQCLTSSAHIRSWNRPVLLSHNKPQHGSLVFHCLGSVQWQRKKSHMWPLALAVLRRRWAQNLGTRICHGSALPRENGENGAKLTSASTVPEMCSPPPDSCCCPTGTPCRKPRLASSSCHRRSFPVHLLLLPTDYCLGPQTTTPKPVLHKLALSFTESES